MELEAPGVDIVGFEHAANTDKQKAAVEAAKKQLAAPQGLFQLSAAAGCLLKETKVEIEDGGEHEREAKSHSDKEHAHKGDEKGDKHDAPKADDDAHSGFKAEYAFECKAPAALADIGFDYFKVFAGAQTLDVTVITPKGQSKFEVSRAKPRIDLGGIM
jgi:pyruvate/2-oxoglutarate dehydrogenase complex dihydrolipoamide acyltransferase (E2) component